MKRLHVLLMFVLLVCFIPIALWGGCLYITETDEEETDGDDLDPPGEVINLMAIPGDEQVMLSWDHPNDSDFAGVKIMCRTDDYPVDHTDGTEVYDGKDFEYNHVSLINGETYYHKAFTYDTDLNFSNGVTANVTPSAIWI